MLHPKMVNAGWIQVEDAGDQKVKIKQMHPLDIRMFGQQGAVRPSPVVQPGGPPMGQATVYGPTHAILRDDLPPVTNEFGAYMKVEDVVVWLWEDQDAEA